MKKVLLIGFLDSPHFARWVELLLDKSDLNLVLFSSSPGRRLNPKLVEILSNSPYRVTISSWSPRYPWFTYLLDLFPLIELRARKLNKCLRETKFDAIHYFEMQHSGYLLTKSAPPGITPVAYSNYGSDIFWFSRFQAHAKKIAKALAITDLVFYECDRDLEFIQNHVKPGARLCKTVNSGGLRERAVDTDKARDTILIKGYSNKWGRALWVLWQLKSARNEIRGKFRIVLYSCDYHVPVLAAFWSALFRIKVESYLKGSLTHEQTLELFNGAIMHIAVSRSDGIPSSTLEAMQGGAIPIQSSTACMEEWIIHGRTGFLIEERSDELLLAFHRILSDADFRAKAAKKNKSAIRDRHDSNLVGNAVAGVYKELLSN